MLMKVLFIIVKNKPKKLETIQYLLTREWIFKNVVHSYSRNQLRNKNEQTFEIALTYMNLSSIILSTKS